ncbi:RNA polymerase II mediator complex component Srb8 [Histoplasma capsulatum var. duboisii H88]|uniref:Mediator of RNA polymerase II transcription subunit 12 n=1 Tax=Ajellomyces capsulatus (strain H88) TaxID=544711 RepID=F0UPT2_AJEC8|nr:RNA polymerase II mediator complex component Srb8 [Histoplasma capsulatum var. duboisii H88]
MIPHPSSHRPPSRPSAPSRRSSAHLYPASDPYPAIDSRPHQNTVIDLTESDHSGAADGERPAKRPRLDAGNGPSQSLEDPLQNQHQQHHQSQNQSSSQHHGSSTASEAPESSMNPLDIMNASSTEQTARPPWSFRSDIRRTGPGAQTELAQWSQSASLPPLPIRPWKYGIQGRHVAGATNQKDNEECGEVTTTPYRIDVPSIAPRFADNKPADFTPWRGSHPEDVLSEQTIKQGFYDRSPAPPTESTSARTSVYPHFKRRSGLKLLSSVFAAALEKRQALCTITAASTFRPPPRVTLTDIKREAWLRDLANPSVPLRRLSRTIPHGIRGKLLLDQCLGKSIPICRAIWLAKCVGANELRAFKRKGTSAGVASGLETKWVRDWTISVQQFIEGVIASFGDASWKLRISYSIRLSARLFLEHLIEQDHFLDWFLTSLDNSSFESLPVWLLMVGVYWQNIVRYRKRAKRLAECLLEKLRLVSDAGQNAHLNPLAQRLSRLTKTLTLYHPSSFILPRTWAKYESVLSSCLDMNLADDKAAFQNLKARNTRVCRLQNDRGKPIQSINQRLIQLLDSSSDVSTICSECLNISQDYSILVTKLIEWASTSFRYGTARTYTVVRVFRKWKRSGVDIDSHILSFLIQDHRKSGVRFFDVYHVICELHVSADIGLLGHLPPHRLPSHIWNLRNTLLSRTGFSVALENATIQLIKASVRRRLPHMFPMLSIDGDAEMTDDVDLTSLSWTVRSEIGNWIRDQVASHVKNSLKSAIDRDFASEVKTSALTPQEFFEVRYILECLCDFSMLADVLKYASGSNNVTVVASAVDTLNYHLDSFNAIGATGDLFKSFTGAYARISKTELSVQDLIASLLDVAIKLPAELSTLSMLRRDQLQRDRKLAMAACSPVSDHIVDTLNTANPTFTEELDQLLTSGNSMDESTLARIFDTLRKKLEAGSVNGEQSAHETARYFANLRPFNTKLFDNLMIKWVISVMRSSPRPKLSSILPPLIGVGCVTLHSFYVLARAFLHSDAHKNAIPDLAELRIDMIQLLDDKLSNGNGSQDLVAYRFKIARQGYMRQYSGEALGLIQDLLADLSENGADTPPKQFKNDLLSTIVTPLFCEVIVRHPSIVGLAAAERTIESINDFSLPLCLINLRLLFSFECDNDVKKRIYDVVFEAAKSNMHKGQPHWIDVVGTLHADAAKEIRQRAEEQLLSLVLSSDSLPASPVSKSGAPTSVTASALVCLRIVEDLSFSVPENGSPSLGPMLIEKMNMVLHRITILESHIMNTNIMQYNDQAAAIRQAHATQESAITFWFYILLRLVSIHRSTFTLGTLSKSDLADQSRLLISITCIALSKTLSPKVPSARPYYIPPTTPLMFAVPPQSSQPQPLFYSTDAGISTNLRTQALDVAATLLDSIPDDSRHQCSRFFRDRCPPFLHPQNNPRLFFLLGPLAADTQPSSSTMQSSQQQPVAPSLSQTTLGPPASTATPAAGAPPGVKSNSSSSQQFQSGNIYNTTNFLPFDDQNSLVGKLRVQHPGGIVGRFPLRPWEMLEESAPVIGVNDTAVDLGWFAARRVRGDVI